MISTQIIKNLNFSKDFFSKLPDDTQIAKIKSVYKQSTDNKNGKIQKKLNFLINHAGYEKKLLKDLEKGLHHYSTQYLNKIGYGDNYTTSSTNINDTNEVNKEKSATKAERAIAVNQIFELIKKSSAEDVYNYLKSAQCQKLIGGNEINFNFLRKHLIEYIKVFIKEYEYFKKNSSPDIITEILMDENIARNITEEDLAILFWYYQPALVAHFILKVYADDSIKLSSNDDSTYADKQFLEQFLAGAWSCVDSVNNYRASIKASQLLPENARSPGKNQLIDEELSQLELFQYDENAIFASEQYLRENYSSILANKIKNEEGFVVKDQKAPYYFYLLSAAPYMLLRPDDLSNQYFQRYECFKKHINELIASCDDKVNYLAKPIIFCGIINIDGTHYLPYFIYKNKQGIVEVITVDPSPITMQTVNNQLFNGKINLFIKLKMIFQDTFKQCEVTNINVTQMLRERDCGPNSATTLKDAFSSCLSNQPLIYIKGDQLCFDDRQLSVRGNTIGMNYYTQSFMYSQDLENASLRNRAWWMQELGKYQKVAPLTIRMTGEKEDEDRPMSINDIYDLNDQFYKDFNLQTLAESQDHQDTQNMNISAVQSLLLGSEEGSDLIKEIVKKYQQTLLFPETKDLVKFIKANIKSKEELSLLTSAHETLDELAEAVISVILRDHITAALDYAFTRDVLGNLPITTELNTEKIVEQFIEHYRINFFKLSIYQQRKLKEELLSKTQIEVEEKLKIAHSARIEMLLENHILTCLTKLPENVDEIELPNAIIMTLSNEIDEKLSPAEIKASIYYLQANFPFELKALVHSIQQKKINEIASKMRNKLLAVLKTHIVEFKDLVDLIYADEDISPNLKKFRELIKKEINSVCPISLTPDIVNTYFGALIGEQINTIITQNITFIVIHKIEDQIAAIGHNQQFIKLLIGEESIQNLLDHLNDQAKQVEYFSITFW